MAELTQHENILAAGWRRLKQSVRPPKPEAPPPVAVIEADTANTLKFGQEITPFAGKDANTLVDTVDGFSLKGVGSISFSAEKPVEPSAVEASSPFIKEPYQVAVELQTGNQAKALKEVILEVSFPDPRNPAAPRTVRYSTPNAVGEKNLAFIAFQAERPLNVPETMSSGSPDVDRILPNDLKPTRPSKASPLILDSSKVPGLTFKFQMRGAR